MPDKKFSITFYGAAHEVTGACYLFETGNKKVLIDCGFFQGTRESEARNHKPFPFKPKDIDALILTHAHLDHIGRVPKLVKDGFRGAIFSTPATRDLAEIMWHDALRFEEREREPLYAEKDIENTMTLFRTAAYYEPIELEKDFVCQLVSAGHILGSSMIRAKVGGRTLAFSGDVGNEPSILLPPRASIAEANVMVLESTYGNRLHKRTADRVLFMERALEDVVARRGTLLIPVFATERTQEILHVINELMALKRVPEVKVFVDSPLAIRSTKIFERYPDNYRPEIQELFRKHPHLFQFKLLKFTESVDESKAINEVPPPKVILAGSGMMSGGRILHHAKRYLGDPSSIVLFVGFQTAGSLGRRIIERAEEVKIHGETIQVRAESRVIEGFSAHADQDQLLQVVDDARDYLKKVFVVHGEPDAAMHLSQMVQDKFGIPVSVPEYGERFEM